MDEEQLNIIWFNQLMYYCREPQINNDTWPNIHKDRMWKWINDMDYYYVEEVESWEIGKYIYLGDILKNN